MNRKERRGKGQREPLAPLYANTVYGQDRNIPCTYKTVPQGYTEGSATQQELYEAGLREIPPTERESGTAPLTELLGGSGEIPFATFDAESLVYALRDLDGKIVATWEGRPLVDCERVPGVRAAAGRGDESAPATA